MAQVGEKGVVPVEGRFQEDAVVDYDPDVIRLGDCWPLTRTVSSIVLAAVFDRG